MLYRKSKPRLLQSYSRGDATRVQVELQSFPLRQEIRISEYEPISAGVRPLMFDQTEGSGTSIDSPSD